MGDQNNNIVLYMFFLFMLSQNGQSWGWLFSSKEKAAAGENPSENAAISGNVVADFTMESWSNRKGIQLVENARNKMVVSNSCWQKAYGNLFAGCSKILADEENRSRLAWHLSDCFQKDSGRPPFPYCDTKSKMLKCLSKLDEDSHKVYLEFYLETNSICHQLQADAFKRQTEKLVNDLKKSAQDTEDKLGNIQETTKNLLQSSHHIHDSLGSIDIQTQKVAKTTKNVEDHVDTVLKRSEAVYEQTKEIAFSQSELQEIQAQMKHKLEESMTTLNESYNNVVQEICRLKTEAVEIEKKISEIGDKMTSKMSTLQNRADEIGNMAEISLDKQKQLVDGQSVAFESLQNLTRNQSQALEESRATLQQLTELGRKQKDELVQRQKELQLAHDRLAENSKTILEAQKAFESKQARMFGDLDKLFNLHNAMLLESRLIKAFIIYTISIFILYMFTSTKQTYAVRPRLYIGLCATFMTEFAILRHTTKNIEQQTRIISLVRSFFVLIASIQLLHAIFTYRDFELLNHHMLLKLMDQLNGMRANKEYLEDSDSDSDVNWSLWVDTELPDDIGCLEDPDYILPEEIGENPIATTKKIQFP